MSDLRAVAAYALLRKTAVQNTVPAPVPVQAPDPMMDGLSAIEQQAEKKKKLNDTRRKVVGANRSEFQAEKDAAALEQEKAAAQQEELQLQQEAQQAANEQAMAQVQQEAPNRMVQANQQVAMQQKTAGAAPFYFGIPDLAKLHIFRPDVPRFTGDER
jgi:hypothetical protein